MIRTYHRSEPLIDFSRSPVFRSDVLPFDLIRPSRDGSFDVPAQAIDLPDEGGAEYSERTPYVLAADLATAVNTAIAVDQPLLVTGEPGSGKTALAWAIAGRLGTSVESFFTKSTSVARDLLYSMDAVRRFHDASVKLEVARDARHYVTLQALGRAFANPHSRVVLIDEIDKAPRDFPNDLLRELEEKAFTIQETGETIRQSVRHVIIITSNGERRLSDAFLRRCVHAHIPFPDPDELRRIAVAHVQTWGVPLALIDAAIVRFNAIRGLELTKNPATSELLAWILVLHRRGISADALATSPFDRLPGIELIVKLREDRERLRT